MRVSAITKAATRQRILQAARRLLAEKGYEATTTRAIAEAAEIASGTVFNYFPTKEAIIACLANDAINEAMAEADAGQNPGESLEEDLFAVIALGLRKLKPLRKHLPALMETCLSPLAVAGQEESSFRSIQLEAVAMLVTKRGCGPLSPVALQLYWTLYTGVLVFWANDTSPKQEDTLALIDDSLNMFVGWLRDDPRSSTSPHK
jgi:AcrR family transcriptional regulator